MSELRAAAERRRRGYTIPNDLRHYRDDCEMLSDYAVQRLTAPLPADLEAELTSSSEQIYGQATAGDRFSVEWVEKMIRPLLQRAAGGRADDGTRDDVHDLRTATLGMPLDG